MEIIGLSGYARCGKDSAAEVLVKEFGFTRVAFADKLREVLYALDPIVELSYVNFGGDMFHANSLELWTVQKVIDTYGWDGYKETGYGDEIRRLLQRLGTEAGRQTLWDSIWVDAALTGHPDDARLVITDCRFPNEAQAIKDRGGNIWRIKRTGVGPANSHASETSLDDWSWDHMISNNGTVEQFREAVRNTYQNKRPSGNYLITWAAPIRLDDFDE